MSIILPGYVGSVWSTVKATLTYMNANLPGLGNSQSMALAQAVAATLKNASGAISVYQTYQGMRQIYANIATITPISLNIPSGTYDFLLNRASAMQSAALSLSSLLPLPGVASSLLPTNTPVISDPKYLEWLIAFNFETPPSGLTTATVAQQAQADADAWAAITTALRQQSVAYPGAAFNTANLMGYCAQEVADLLVNPNLSSSIPVAQLWNQMEAMPVITRAISATVNDPTSLISQNTVVAKYVILQALQYVNSLIIALRQSVEPTVRLGTLREGDNLMTFANRNLGDYALWRQVAQLNGLQPPYVSSIKGPNLATPGQQLFLPSRGSQPGATQQSSIDMTVASYTDNYLGIDKFLGPLNAPMLVWTGDYQIISGYDNLQFSIGRRLQTTLSTLIYHNLFGSRIPPLIGKVESGTELATIEQYARSCILSDPRIDKIVSCKATQGPNYSIRLVAVAIPNGLNQKNVTLDVVLGPP